MRKDGKLRNNKSAMSSPVAVKSVTPQVTKHIDYLKQAREIGKVPNKAQAVKEWEQDFKNKSLKQEDRHQIVKHKADAMMIKASIYEQGINESSSKFDNLEDQKTVNDLYLESIKAKLAVLNEL